jgi:hypothetical protein
VQSDGRPILGLSLATHVDREDVIDDVLRQLHAISAALPEEPPTDAAPEIANIFPEPFAVSDAGG